jgi:hypothetical protein
MKTLSGRFRFVVLGVIAIVAVASCCNFPFIPDIRISSYSVEIGSKQRVRRYVEWKTPAQFKAALDQVCAHYGNYDFYVLESEHAEETHLKKDCKHNPPGNIRTVKVTKSKVADDIAAGESAVNDPHVTYRVQSPDPGDIIKVLDALKK